MTKQVQGRKWKKPVSVKNKNCYNLTDIDARVKGLDASEKYSRYRALFNAIIGGNTTKKIPPIGSYNIGEKERNIIKSITKLIFAKDFVIIFKGNNYAKVSLVDMQTLESLYNNSYDGLKTVRKYIQSYEKFEDQISINNVAFLAGLYRDMLLNKEKTVPNEKKAMIDILTNNLCVFSGIEEVILVADTFTDVEVVTALGKKLKDAIPPYLSQLESIATEELGKEINGFREFNRKLEAKKVRLENLRVISIIYGDLISSMKGYKSGQTITEYVSNFGLNIEVVYSSEVKNEVVKEVLKTETDTETVETLYAEVEKEFDKVFKKWLRYSNIVRVGHFYYEQANEYEKKLWLEYYTISKLKKCIEEEYLYLRSLNNKKAESQEEKPDLSLEAFRQLMIEGLGKNDTGNALHTLKVLAPKFSKDDKHTPSSLGWDLETKEGLKKILTSIKDLESLVDDMIDIINGVVYFTLAQFLTRFGAQGIIFTDKMVSMLKDNQEYPFMYTEKILESANRIFRAYMGVPRGQEDTENVLGLFRDWVKKCIIFLNPNAVPTIETGNKLEVQNKVYKQICLIFEQYKKYLMIK